MTLLPLLNPVFPYTAISLNKLTPARYLGFLALFNANAAVSLETPKIDLRSAFLPCSTSNFPSTSEIF